MRTIGIITSRFNSTRLPGKALMDICGKPMLQRVYDRVKSSEVCDEVVVATSLNSLPIIEYCSENHIPCYAGSEDDQLDRIYQTAKEFKADVIVRIWGDCPLIDPEWIRYVYIRFLDRPEYSYTTHVPRGQMFSIIPFGDLEERALNSKDLARYEFNELNEHNGWKSFSAYFPPTQLSYLCYPDVYKDVGTQEDLEFVRGIYHKLGF